MATAAGRNLDLHFIPTPKPTTVTALKLGQGTVGIARVRSESGGIGLIHPPVVEDAFLVSHHLSNIRTEVWVDGKPVAKPDRMAGRTSIHDFRRSIACRVHTAFDSIAFYLPKIALETMLPNGLNGSLDDLTIAPSETVEDPVIAGLAATVLPLVCRPELSSALLLDHLGCALALHMTTVYTRARVEERAGGTLAIWQERRVKEMIDARLDGDIQLADLAAECRLSVGHFARAFRQTTNTTPYQWLLRRRVERAKSLMHDTERSLAAVALECGFADQSHFTRTFTRIAGLSPNAWRRHHAVSARGETSGMSSPMPFSESVAA